MIFPILIIAALGLVVVDQYKRGRAPTATLTSGSSPAQAAHSHARATAGVAALTRVLADIQVGVPPDPTLVQLAISTAQAASRPDLVQIIASAIAPYVTPAMSAWGAATSPATPGAPGAPPVGVTMAMAMTPWGPTMVPVVGPPASPAPATPGQAPTTPAQAIANVEQALGPLAPAAPAAAPAATLSQGEAAPATAPERRMLPSPFRHVDSNSWTYFVSQLQCEPVDFESKRHIGAFRQRKDRLADLGIPEPRNADEQYAALKADVLDSYKHAEQSGLFSETVARPIDADGRGEVPVTPSGVLGVICAAGLEGAYNWFTNPDDRKRFPGTTKVFLATNGAF